MSDLTTSARLPRVHALNFGLRIEQDHPVTAENVARALAEYDPADVAAVSSWLRANSSLDAALDRWEQVYADALDGHDATGTDPVEALHATARYLSGLVPAIKARADGWAAEERTRAELEAELEEGRRRWAAVTGSRAWRASTFAWRVNARLPRRSARD
jgi:hypothetical protein